MHHFVNQKEAQELSLQMTYINKTRLDCISILIGILRQHMYIILKFLESKCVVIRNAIEK